MVDTALTIDLILEDDSPWAGIEGVGDWVESARTAAETALGLEGQVALLLTDDAHIHQLNAQFRHKDKPTDVLSFQAHPKDHPFLGDIAIAYGVMTRDAAEAGKLLSAHLIHIILHGLLHLEGHDHETEADATKMEALEIKALASLGLSDPYSF